MLAIVSRLLVYCGLFLCFIPSGNAGIVEGGGSYNAEFIQYFTNVFAKDTPSFARATEYVDSFLFIAEEGVPSSTVTVINTEQKKNAMMWYRYQELAITAASKSMEEYILLLPSISSRIDIIKEENNIFHIYIDSFHTHTIRIQYAITATRPTIAIVIDDVGENLTKLKELSSLPLAVSYAIWPFAQFTKESAEYITKQGADILIHMPMEPLGYPNVMPGKGVLLRGMSARTIGMRLQNAFDAVPEAIGMNNHMGSAMTIDIQAVEAIVAYTVEKKPHFIILDSLTNPKSLLHRVSKKYGAKSIQRSIFIDHIRTVEDTKKQLYKMERLAKKYGSIVAIGHPAPTTIQALQEWLPTKDAYIHFVKISELFKVF